MVKSVDYAPLDLRSLGRDLHLRCDLYIEEKGRYVLYREASLPFTRVDCSRLLDGGVDTLWINSSLTGQGRSQEQFLSLFVLPDEQLPPLAKARLWYCSAITLAQRAISGLHLNGVLPSLQKLMQATVDFLSRCRDAFPALLSAMLHDSSLHTHAVNVSTYALGLGRFIGLTNPWELWSLGLGAFLHDVGKTKVPRQMLNKPGPLSSDEWLIMRRHPGWGKTLLSKSSELSETVLATVVQHHERLDGSGYPDGIGGKDLHQFAKIVALVDSFDAMTSYRPYSPPRSPYDALSVLKNDTREKLDAGLFTSLVQLLGNPASVSRLQPI